MTEEKRIQLKFLKDQIGHVLDGSKTIEIRPRSRNWIERIAGADLIDLTYGARFKPPTIFATAKLLKIEIRAFESTKKEDLKKLSIRWKDKEPQEFIDVHNEWYKKELKKGYPVAWIHYQVIKKYT